MTVPVTSLRFKVPSVTTIVICRLPPVVRLVHLVTWYRKKITFAQVTKIIAMSKRQFLTTRSMYMVFKSEAIVNENPDVLNFCDLLHI